MFSGFARTVAVTLICVQAAFAAVPGPVGSGPHARIPVAFTLEEPGYLTLVIEDVKGKRVSNLIADTYFEAGRHVIYWDGYDVGDKLGKEQHYDVRRHRIKAGEYRVGGLVHDGMALSYQVSVQSPGKPPWFTADRSGGWLADHTPPVDVLYLPDGSPHGDQPQVMVSAPTGEAGHSTMWLDLDGRKLFGAKIRGWNSGVVNCRDEGDNTLDAYYCYALIREEIHGLLRDTDGGKMYERLVRLEIPEGPEDGWHWLELAARRDMAIRNGIVAISYPQSDAIVIVDLKRSKDRQFGEIKFEDPRGLAYDEQGRLYMTSNGRVLRFDKPDLPNGRLGEPQTVVDGLDDPGRVRLGPEGEILVSVFGEKHQILVFDSSGELINEIGKAGGPQFGRYDEERMARPSGMAVDERGMLWVAEADYGPKRISRWHLNSGQFDRAWYGPPKYGGGGHIDPRDRTRFYYSSGLQGMEFTLDWENDRNMPPRAIYWRKGYSEGRCPDSSIYINGRHYMSNRFFGPAYFAKGSLDVFLYNEDKLIAERIAHVGRPPREDDEQILGASLDEHPELKRVLEEKAWHGHWKGRHMIWSDLNLDKMPQPEELQFINFREHPGQWDLPSLTMAKDMSIATTDGVHIPPPRFNEKGVPVWDLSKWQTVAVDRSEHLSDVVQAHNETFIFPMGQYSKARICRAYRNNEMIWHINGWKAQKIAERPGQLINAQRCIGYPFTLTKGQGGQMFVLNGYKGSLYVLTTDGLYVTDLGGDERTKPTLSYPEAYKGLIVKDVTFKSEHFWPATVQMRDGTVYVMAGKESSSVFELLGAETIRRIPAWSINVSEQQLDDLPEKMIVPGALRKIEKTATISLSDEAPVIDGLLGEWQDADWMEIYEQFDAYGAVKIHGNTLYAAWQTNASSLLNNDAADGRQYIFASGGGLDLMVRTDFEAEESRGSGLHSSVAKGDVRLFVTRVDDPVKGPVQAVRFQQSGGKRHGESVNYTSPVGAVEFDSVRDVSDGVHLAQRGGNYELSVPLNVLGLEGIEEGKTTIGDIGILVGNGSDTKLRMYWNNKAAQMTSDIPSEARLMPSEWGTWKFEK